MDGPIIPAEIGQFSSELANERYAARGPRQEFVQGFSEGFKSSLLNKSPHLQSISGVEARDAGFREGRSTGLQARVTVELRDVSLYSYGYVRKIVQGLMYFNFEQHDFRLLDSLAAWWVAGSQVSYQSYYALQEEIPPVEQPYSVYACVEALVSPEGTHGHFGAYLREMIITAINEIRLATPTEVKARKDLETRAG